jgi:hypothetical protein
VRIQRLEHQSAASLRESLLREAASLRVGGEVGHRGKALRLIGEAAALSGPPNSGSERATNCSPLSPARTSNSLRSPLPGLPPAPALSAVHPRFNLFAHVEHAHQRVFRALAEGTNRGSISPATVPLRASTSSVPTVAISRSRRATNSVSWYLSTGQRCLTSTGANLAFAFHPREESILIETTPNEAHWFELPKGTERLHWTAPLPRPAGRTNGWHALAFSPDGRTLAGASGTSQLVELMDPQSGAPISYITNYNNGHAITLAWSRRGDLLAFATYNSHIVLAEPDTGRTRWNSPAMIASARSLAFDDTGQWLVAACEDDTLRLVDVAAERFVFEHPGHAHRVSFSPNGERVGPLHLDGRWGWLEFRRPEEFTGFTVGIPCSD